MSSLIPTRTAHFILPITFLWLINTAACGQTPGNPNPAQTMPERGYTPQLKQRPVPQNPGKPEGKIHLNVVVANASGKPVAGIDERDFTLLEDGRPRKIVSFEPFGGNRRDFDPRVEVILLIDQLNQTFQQVAFVRSEISRFLLRNNGRLAQPVSLMVLSDAGLRMQSRPSVDGNALLTVLEQLKGSSGGMNSNKPISEKFLLSVRELANIAQIEGKRPGRKLLIWMGPGWTVDSPYFSFKAREQELIFDTIVEISNRLREAGVVVNSVSGNQPGAGIDGFDQVSDLNAMTTTFLYESFLRGVSSAKQAQRGDLDLKVFAIHTGGLIQGPGNDVVAQIEECITDADIYYRISFDPEPAAHPDEYHDLKVEISRPGLTARTNTGFYNEPAWK